MMSNHFHPNLLTRNNLYTTKGFILPVIRFYNILISLSLFYFYLTSLNHKIPDQQGMMHAGLIPKSDTYGKKQSKSC